MPKSISEFACLNNYSKYLLAILLIGGGIALWLISVNKLPNNMLWMSWLTAISLGFVAVTPVCEDNPIHTPAAILAGICTTGLTLLLCPQALLIWSVYVIYTLISSNAQYKVLVSELCCIIQTLCI